MGRISPVKVIPLTLHLQLNIVLTKRTRGQSLGTFQQSDSLTETERRSIGWKSTITFLHPYFKELNIFETTGYEVSSLVCYKIIVIIKSWLLPTKNIFTNCKITWLHDQRTHIRKHMVSTATFTAICLLFTVYHTNFWKTFSQVKFLDTTGQLKSDVLYH